MKRIHLILIAAAATTSLAAGTARAGLVQIELVNPITHSHQTMKLTVPLDCARTTWPAYVLSCIDLEPVDEEQERTLPTVFVAPSGKLLGIARGDLDYAQAVRDDDGSVSGVGHPKDDVQRMGTTYGGGASIWLQSDAASGEPRAAYVVFTDAESFRQWRSGEEETEAADRPLSWGGIKALHR